MVVSTKFIPFDLTAPDEIQEFVTPLLVYLWQRQ
nr:Uncharacterised protein [Salmonella sp. NCTC 7297]